MENEWVILIMGFDSNIPPIPTIKSMYEPTI